MRNTVTIPISFGTKVNKNQLNKIGFKLIDQYLLDGDRYVILEGKMDDLEFEEAEKMALEILS